MNLKETDTLTLPILRRAIKTLKSHNRKLFLSTEGERKLRQSFDLFMGRNRDNEELRECMRRPI